MSALLDLAERCEAATGPDRSLDCDLHAIWNVHHETHWKGVCDGIREGRDDMRIPRFTASLDAAMTLVPEGWWLQYIGQVIGGWSCRVETNEALPSIGTGFPPKQPVATSPLALCAAALRARAAEQSALNREGGNG